MGDVVIHDNPFICQKGSMHEFEVVEKRDEKRKDGLITHITVYQCKKCGYKETRSVTTDH